MPHLVVLLVPILPALLFFCFKPQKAQRQKSQVQQWSGDAPKPQPSISKPVVLQGVAQTALHHPSSGEDKPKTTKMPAPPGSEPSITGMKVEPRAKKSDQPPSSGGSSHVAVRRGGASSAKLAKSLSKKRMMNKTPKRINRNHTDSLKTFTCEDPRTKDKTEEATQIANSVEGNSRTGFGHLTVDKTAQTKESDWSLITAEDEFEFEQAQHQVMGNVDKMMAEHEDWCEYLGDRLVTETEITCEQPTDREMSAVICGNYRIWLADKIGSYVEQEGPPQ